MLVALFSALAVVVAASSAVQLSDEEYYRMPRLFHLDDYEACLSKPGSLYCLGNFQLHPSTNYELFEMMKQFSEHRDNFNHTSLHRGLCVTTRCAHIQSLSSKKRFGECVNEWTNRNYGLEARLTKLDYCRSKSGAGKKPYDYQDMAFINVIGILILLNCAGTAYELLFQPGKKANKLLMSWSLVDNWRRLVADHTEGGDQRLTALKPLQGMKTLTLMCVMLAHTAFAYYKTYIHNTRFFEQVNLYTLTGLLYNGSVIVQTFVMLAGFLLMYNLLLHFDNGNKQPSLTTVVKIIQFRLIRLAPVNMLMVWWAATWWVRMGDGPMWTPLIGTESQRCRNNWWAQLLFINNFVRPHERCFIQTWFLAVDMQLYICAAVLATTLIRWPRVMLPIVVCMFPLSIVANFIVAYNWDLKALLFMSGPKVFREQYAGNDSFTWLYAAPWGSLPASLMGVLLAYSYHYLQKTGFELKKHKLMIILYRSSVPLIFLWIISGWYIQHTTSPVQVALYSALDRPVFIILVSITTVGSLFNLDDLYARILSWRAWHILGRMSLSILMVHWSFIFSYLALRPQAVFTSVLEIWGTWAMVMFVTYLVSLPVHLLIETPIYRFCRSLA